MTKIYYWDGAEGSNTLLTEYKDIILKLLNQDYAPGDLEKLRVNYPWTVYSFRLNQADRLLFTTRIVAGKHYLHILECILKHDYHKSRFLRSQQVLRHYLDVFERLPQDEKRPIFETSPTSSAIHPSPLDYFNQQFIQLRTEQTSLLFQPLPLIVNGVGGSGKTYMALRVMRQFIHSKSDEPPARIVYVTKEATLVEPIKQRWLELSATAPKNIQVEFLTYKELLSQFATVGDVAREKDLYQTWLSNQKKAILDIDEAIQFHEFRICSGHTPSQYEALGEHQSKIPTQQRAELYRQYQRYQTYLTQHRLIDPVVHALEAQPTFHLIVVDEAQNMSLRQLHNLYNLAINQAILYCMDPQQNLIDPAPIRPLLQQLVWTQHQHTLPSVDLNRTYRCAKAITEVVNRVLTAKHHILGKIDKNEASLLVQDDDADAGHVSWLTTKNLDAQAATLAHNTNNYFAVITQPSLLDEARARFTTPLIFTVEEIQGLEYPSVVVYKLLDDQEQPLKTVHSPLITMETDKRSKQIRQDHQLLGPWFNRLYTAYTRAQNTLIICEDVPPHRDGLLRFLKKTPQNKTYELEKTQSNSLPTPDWAAEEAKQRAEGNIRVAQQIHALFSNSPAKVSGADHSTAQLTVDKKSPAESEKSHCDQTKPTQTQTKGPEVMQHFSQPGFISRWVNEEQFISTLFDVPFSLNKKPPETLFYHLTQSEDHTKRFAIAIGARQLNFVTTDFIKRLVANQHLPEAIIKKLIQHILMRDHLVLNEPLIRQWMEEHLTNQRLHSTYVGCCHNDEDCEHFISIMIHSKCIDALDTDTLVMLLTNVHQKTQIDLLWFIACNHVVWLKNHIMSHPDIINKIPLKAWYSARASQFSMYKNITTLYSLTSMNAGRQILALLVTNYPHIINAIPANYWGLALTKKTALLEKVTPLYSLCSSTEGRQILATLVKDYPNIINAIPPESWGLRLTNKLFGPLENISVLYWIASTEDDRKVLATLVKKYPNIINAIPPESWYIELTEKAGDHAHTSVLYFLIKMPDGHSILANLIKNHPNIINAIPIKYWLHIFTQQSALKENKLTFDDLACSSDGQTILTALLSRFFDILEGTAGEDLKEELSSQINELFANYKNSMKIKSHHAQGTHVNRNHHTLSESYLSFFSQTQSHKKEERSQNLKQDEKQADKNPDCCLLP